MDIGFLLWLQELRESLPQIVEEVAVVLSDRIGAGTLLVFACLTVFWAVDRKMGFSAMFCFCLGNFVNQFVKLLACVYRPWVIDPRVQPAPNALDAATGYSFPSGHTVAATSTFGSFAYSLWKKHRILAVLCIVLIVFVGFARNFLGVHTPQDVLVAFAEGALIVFVGMKLVAWFDEHRDRDLMVMVIGLVVGAVCLAIIILKPYPMDYVDGVLLVDPDVMRRDGFEGVGLFTGMFVGWYCERRWVNFSTEGAELSVLARIVRLLVGFALIGAIMLGLDPVLKALVGLSWAKLISRFLLALVAVFVAPLLFRFTDKVGRKR